jgi:hypothetical protein
LLIATPANITYHTPHPESDAAVVDETDDDAVSPVQFVDLSQPIAETATADHLRTNDINDMALHYFEQSSFTEDDSLEDLLEVGNEVSTPEISILACGHKKERNIAEAFEESLNAPNSDEYLPALKIIYGLPNSHESHSRLLGDRKSYGQVEGEHIGRYGISSSKRIRAISDLSTILESQKEYNGDLASRPLGCERLRSVEDRLSCHVCSQDYISSFLSALAKYKELNQWQRVFLAMAVLRGVYFELKRWNDLISTMSEMQKILDNGIEMDHYLTSDVLVEGLYLAGTYSVLKDFASAHSVFSSVLPKLWLLSDAKYESDVIYGYIEIGLHYKRQELWPEAFDYLSLAHKGLAKSGRCQEATFLESHLDQASRSMHETSCFEAESSQRKVLELIEMSRGNTLLKNISHGKTWEVVVKGINKKDEFETDTTSCKYGITYSVSSITGISDSMFMVP